MKFRRFTISRIHKFVFIAFIILLCTFYLCSLARYKKYMICLISFSKLPDILPVFHFAGAIGNLYSIR